MHADSVLVVLSCSWSMCAHFVHGVTTALVRSSFPARPTYLWVAQRVGARVCVCEGGATRAPAASSGKPDWSTVPEAAYSGSKKNAIYYSGSRNY